LKLKNVVTSIFLVILVGAAFAVGQAYATLCYSDTNTVAACWLKNNGIATAYGDGTFRPLNYLTRGDAAVFLIRANKVPPATGDIFFSQSLSSLVPLGDYNTSASVVYYADMDKLKATDLGFTTVKYFQIGLSIPTDLYGRATSLKGIQVCYNTNYSASIVQVSLQRWINVAGDTSMANSVTDDTVRTDKACRVYSFPSPVKLSGSNHVVLYLAGNFPTLSAWVGVNSITAILSPTTTNGILAPEETLTGEMPVPDPATLSGTTP
jgi:hypothetical protein